MEHLELTLKNPRRLRSSSFVQNHNKLHAKDGYGYKSLEDMVLQADQPNSKVRRFGLAC